MEASNEFRRREPTLLAIFAAKGPAAIEFRRGDAAITEKSYQPSWEYGECRLSRIRPLKMTPQSRLSPS
jgi:hypothetical protein